MNTILIDRMRTIVVVTLPVLFLVSTISPNVYAQDKAVFKNEHVVAYEVPDSLSKTEAKSFAKDVATEVGKEITGHAITLVAGNIAGLLFSVIQEIPTVGAPRSIKFRLTPENPVVGGEDIDVTIIHEMGGHPQGFQAKLERKTGLFRWKTLESRQILTTEEVYKLPFRSLLVLRKPFSAPNQHGTYRINVAGIDQEFRIIRVSY